MPPPPRNPRRTTLGPVSMNSNSAAAAAAATPSKIPKPTRKSRQSMMPRVRAGAENGYPQSPSNSVQSSRSSAARRSMGRKSMGGRFAGTSGSNSNSNNTVVKQDPRPINDKAYQQHCIRTLLTYLTKRGYEYPVSMKSLSRPSGKDFQHIVTFLLQQMDPTFANQGTNNSNSKSASAQAPKFEEEVAMHFKALGYPYPVSKTALVAAGSPHTWPSLLAALVWLVEHIVVIQECCPIATMNGQNNDDEFDRIVNSNNDDGSSSGMKFESLAELELKTDRAFFAYLHKSYAAFLDGNADQSDAFTEKLIDMFEQDNMVIEREMDRVTDLNGGIVETIHMLEEQCASLPTLTKKREDYATDLEQFHDLVRQMDDHHGALKQKVEERTAELHATNAELDTMTGRMADLQIKVTNQELSVEDVQKMHLEQARLKEALEKAQSLKRFQKEGLWKSQNKLTTLWEDLDLLLREYSDEATELSRCMTDLNNRVNWKMTLDKTATSTTQMLGVDLANELQPFFQKCKQQNVTLLADARRELQDMLDDLEVTKEARTEAIDHSKIIDSKLDRLEETLETEGEQQEATLQVRLSAVESMETKIESLRDPASLEEQICAYQSQCDQLESLNRKHQEDTVANKRAIQDEIETALAAMDDYNRHVTAKLQELQEYAVQQKEMSVQPFNKEEQ